MTQPMKQLHTFLLALLPAALLVLTPASAKETPPEGSAPKAFTLTAQRSISLPNGLNVTFVQYGKTPKVTVRLLTETGSVDDGAKDAVSELAYQLLLEGSKNRDAKAIAQAAATMGGQVNAVVDVNSSFLELDVLSEFAGEAAALLADIAIHPNFTEADKNRLLTNYVRDLKVEKSQAQSQAAEAFYRHIFGNHPYGKIYADEKVVEGLTLDDFNQFVSTHLVASRSHLFVSGQFDEAKAEAAIRDAFAAMPQGTGRVLTTAESAAKPGLVFIPRDKAVQSTIRIGLPVVDPSHPDYVGLDLMNTLLGGAFSSRITRNIREDKGYTYSPRSSISSRIQAAVWFEQADVTAEATAASLVEIIKEIKLLQSTPPTEQELNGFKNYKGGIFVLQNSSRGAIINQLWHLKTHGLPLSYLEEYVQKTNAVTPQQLTDLAKKYLPVESMTLVVVGDESVKAQLAAVPELKALFKL
ncbi:pitrilysin family protein [Rheinheimera sp.]|uniref:M16 family metallopeptidase n=1 Tax=Rheinheimera sp. TaxID=1869214 RepID=UPI00307E4566